jgi:hypothetical protein
MDWRCENTTNSPGKRTTLDSLVLRGTEDLDRRKTVWRFLPESTLLLLSHSLGGVRFSLNVFFSTIPIGFSHGEEWFEGNPPFLTAIVTFTIRIPSSEGFRLHPIALRLQAASGLLVVIKLGIK